MHVQQWACILLWYAEGENEAPGHLSAFKSRTLNQMPLRTGVSRTGTILFGKLTDCAELRGSETMPESKADIDFTSDGEHTTFSANTPAGEQLLDCSELGPAIN
jgi:hypothetical protein